MESYRQTLWNSWSNKGKPEIAKFNLKATGKWINGGHNRTTIGLLV